MQALTLAVALAGCAIVLLSRPIWWLIIYIGVTVFYPCNLTVPVGTVDFTAGRIVIMVIFARALLFTNVFKGFKLIWLDKLVIIFFIAQVAAGLMTIPMMELLENRAGAVFDLVLPYFIARATLKKRRDFILLIKAVMVMAIPMAALGLYQSVTGDNPYGGFRAYVAWGSRTAAQSAQQRYGFYRASVSFPQPIMFGMFFGMLGPVAVGLYHYIKNKTFFLISLAAMGVGVFSSMSSGPYFAAALAGMFICVHRYRRQWKTLLVIVIVLCAVVEIISNRHFYEVFDRFSLSGSAVWYRSRLIEVALFEGGMDGHWLIGYGNEKLKWGKRIDGRSYTDVVNHYLVILSRYGLIGLIPFLVLVAAAMMKLIKTFKQNNAPPDAWLLWCFSGTMIGVILAMNTVMLFGPPRTLFYILLALCAQLPSYCAKRRFIYVPADYQPVTMQQPIVEVKS